MKKRSFLTVLLSVVIALVLCIGFAGCGYKSIKGKEVADEAAWQEAVSMENICDAKLQVSVKLEVGGEKGSGTATVTVDKDGNAHIKETYKGSIKESQEVGSGEWYQDNNGKFYCKNAEGKWEKKSYGAQGFAMPIVYYAYGIAAMVSAEDFMLEELEYSKKEKGYLYEYENANEAIKLVYKISGERMVAVYRQEKNGTIKTEITVTISYGKQKVNLPNVEGSSSAEE